MRLILAFILSSGLGAATAASGQSAAPRAGQDAPAEVSQEAPTVPFCELVARPELYENKTVRVRAQYLSTWEWSRFYGSECNTADNFVWPMFNCQTLDECQALRDLMKRNLSGDPYSGRRGEMLLVGRLKGPTKERPRFGVQRGYRFGFEVSRVEQVTPARAPTRRPRSKGRGRTSRRARAGLTRTR